MKAGQAGNQFGFRPGNSTLDAMSKVRSAYKNANGRGQAYNLFVGILTLDVKNAFNSNFGIKSLYYHHALARKNTPPYLLNIIGRYLSERKIIVHAPDGSARHVNVSCGVPQGSVLGPDLWNALYDELLEIQLPPDVEIIAFADDVALLATASVPFLLEERLEQALGDVVEWLTANGLELAIEKSEAVLLTNRNKHIRMTIRFQGHLFESKPAVKYLGVSIDPRLHFREHAELAAKRASDTCRHLTQILRTRKVLATVVTSQMLYGAPFWFPSITAEALHQMEVVYRRVMLRVACCYRTVSYEAAAVVWSMHPLALLAEERLEMYGDILKSVARDHSIRKWQTAWDTVENGRWTHRLITEVTPWLRRQHGEVSFHLSQVLTGHGCFGEYLHRFGKSDSDSCALCGASPDDVEHAVFQCDAFHRWRAETCVYLDVNQLTADNVIGIMLRSNSDWQRVTSLIGRIMSAREEEERTRQHAPGGAQGITR
ncbi:Reverse transcriptase domain-containing protein [Aphis craccivora]|uniref:Reverse transcriptase domain-containing protein n=1 Tax=Aphis craccivora TaxID=307492 RepID=A0A6G0YQE4_APHCR|nr:Reverse transcriptase domain-containing protein [Aphis craccivora]